MVMKYTLLTQQINDGIITTVARVRDSTMGSHTFPIFVHNDELYFTDCVYRLCKIPISNGNIQTIAGIENEKGFNGDDMLATHMHYMTLLFIAAMISVQQHDFKKKKFQTASR